MSTVIDEHREYLSDGPRLTAFREAIAELVTPDSVVLDLGCGTGILGLLACRAGAKLVYAVDEGGMIEVARSLCEANAFTNQMRFIKGLSIQIVLPERVDLVVADQIGHFGFEAGICEYFRDARARFLKPNGRMIPSRRHRPSPPLQRPQRPRRRRQRSPHRPRPARSRSRRSRRSTRVSTAAMEKSATSCSTRCAPTTTRRRTG